jgi:osmotically-inducible protein OsmY
MVRALLRLIVIVVVLIAVGAFFFGYRWGGRTVAEPAIDRPIGTTGEAGINTERARQTGAAIGEQVAVGASRAEQAVAGASLTAKIKSKMALDDFVEAADIDVDTDGSVVTLNGRVESEEERARALQLARETEGVTQVVDRLTVVR